MKRLLAGLALALLIVSPVSAAKPPTATLVINGTDLHWGDHPTVTVNVSYRQLDTSVWVRLTCQGSGTYQQDAGVWDWTGTSGSFTGTAGPFSLGSGLAVVSQGGAGTTAGDWFSGPADCQAYVWDWKTHGDGRISDIVAFHVSA